MGIIAFTTGINCLLLVQSFPNCTRIHVIAINFKFMNTVVSHASNRPKVSKLNY